MLRILRSRKPKKAGNNQNQSHPIQLVFHQRPLKTFLNDMSQVTAKFQFGSAAG